MIRAERRVQRSYAQ